MSNDLSSYAAFNIDFQVITPIISWAWEILGIWHTVQMFFMS